LSMSEVFSIRIPRELKRRLERLRGVVDWRSEVVSFLEGRVKYYERVLALRKINELISKHPEVPKGFATESVRGDRDSH